MKIIIDNSITTLRWGLNVLRWVGFVVPDTLYGVKKMLLSVYSCFWFTTVGGDVTQDGGLALKCVCRNAAIGTMAARFQLEGRHSRQRLEELRKLFLVSGNTGAGSAGMVFSKKNANNLDIIRKYLRFNMNTGIYVITQTGDLIQVWGDISLMTDTSFLLFTNFAFTTKIINVMVQRDKIQGIVNEGDAELTSEMTEEGRAIVMSSNKESTRLLASYVIFAAVTVLGWAGSAEKGSLPLRAWYPYDFSNSPAYELTYFYQVPKSYLSGNTTDTGWFDKTVVRFKIFHTCRGWPFIQLAWMEFKFMGLYGSGIQQQSVTVVLMAMINVSLDILVTSLTAVCRCRLKLLALSLKTICRDISFTDEYLLTPEDDKRVSARLGYCVMRHKAILESAAQIKGCFTVPILAQFTVSMVIICVTAYQLAVESHTNNIRLISMTAYLIAMILQVFIYCYQGTYLSEESMEVADAVYECPWYSFLAAIKRSLLVTMVRAHSAIFLTAGGFSTLSLDCFVSIIKASYSFFTVLQQMEE